MQEHGNEERGQGKPRRQGEEMRRRIAGGNYPIEKDKAVQVRAEGKFNDEGPNDDGDKDQRNRPKGAPANVISERDRDHARLFYPVGRADPWEKYSHREQGNCVALPGLAFARPRQGDGRLFKPACDHYSNAMTSLEPLKRISWIR